MDASQTHPSLPCISRILLENSAIGCITYLFVFSVWGRGGNAMYPEDLHLITREWWITSRCILLRSTKYTTEYTLYTAYTTLLTACFLNTDFFRVIDCLFLFCFGECSIPLVFCLSPSKQTWSRRPLLANRAVQSNSRWRENAGIETRPYSEFVICLVDHFTQLIFILEWGCWAQDRQNRTEQFKGYSIRGFQCLSI